MTQTTGFSCYLTDHHERYFAFYVLETQWGRWFRFLLIITFNILFDTFLVAYRNPTTPISFNI